MEELVPADGLPVDTFRDSGVLANEFEAGEPAVGDQGVENVRLHEIVEGVIVARFVVDQELEQSSADIGDGFADGVFVFEAPLDDGNGSGVVDGRGSGLDVGVEDGEGGFSDLFAFVEIDAVLALAAVGLLAAKGIVDFLHPGFVESLGVLGLGFRRYVRHC